jgi:hypothetical protein
MPKSQKSIIYFLLICQLLTSCGVLSKGVDMIAARSDTAPTSPPIVEEERMTTDFPLSLYNRPVADPSQQQGANVVKNEGRDLQKMSKQSMHSAIATVIGVIDSLPLAQYNANQTKIIAFLTKPDLLSSICWVQEFENMLRVPDTANSINLAASSSSSCSIRPTAIPSSDSEVYERERKLFLTKLKHILEDKFKVQEQEEDLLSVVEIVNTLPITVTIRLLSGNKLGSIEINQIEFRTYKFMKLMELFLSKKAFSNPEYLEYNDFQYNFLDSCWEVIKPREGQLGGLTSGERERVHWCTFLYSKTVLYPDTLLCDICEIGGDIDIQYIIVQQKQHESYTEAFLKQNHPGSQAHPYGCSTCHTFKSGQCIQDLECFFCHICPNKPRKMSKAQIDLERRKQERGMRIGY